MATKNTFTLHSFSQDRREGGRVARIVTRGPVAFRGPERHTIFIFSSFSVFHKERPLSQRQRAHWPFNLSLYFLAVYRRACPPKRSVSPVNLRAWSKEKVASPKNFRLFTNKVGFSIDKVGLSPIKWVFPLKM